MEAIGLITTVFFGLILAVSVLWYPFKFVKGMITNVCPRCDGYGGWDSWLLVFSKHSYQTCHKCKGTGKFWK